MDDAAWLVPHGAAQPIGIQSTAGAIPIMNEKGEVSMKKVKVQRYISGKRPEYAPASSDEEEIEDEDFTKPKASAYPPSPPHKALTEAELQDPRMRRLRAARQSHYNREDDDDSDTERDLSTRVHHKAEVIEMSDEEEQETRQKDDFSSASHRLPETDSESEGEMDDEALADRRQEMRVKARQRVEQEQEVLGKEDEGSEESSEEESSEYTEESDSEEEGPRLKPVFVRKKDRVTIHQKDAEFNKAKQLEMESKKRTDERRRDTLKMIEHQHRATAASVAAQNGDPKATDVNTDDEADDAEYEAWKLRELRRLKRDKEEREQMDKEKEEVERLRTMTEEQRRLELRNNPKMITNKALKGKYKFLQKYYHRGAFFLDDDQEVFKRDFSGATLEDHFDKTILPKVMQVKNFGRSGRTKYTHLVDQDTTSFESPWAADTQMNHKFANNNSGGLKQSFDKPSTTTTKRSSQSSSSSRK